MTNSSSEKCVCLQHVLGHWGHCPPHLPFPFSVGSEALEWLQELLQRELVATPQQAHPTCCMVFYWENQPNCLFSQFLGTIRNNFTCLHAVSRVGVVGHRVPSLQGPVQSGGVFVHLALLRVRFLWPRKDLFPVVRWLVNWQRIQWAHGGSPVLPFPSVPMLSRRYQESL